MCTHMSLESVLVAGVDMCVCECLHACDILRLQMTCKSLFYSMQFCVQACLATQYKIDMSKYTDLLAPRVRDSAGFASCAAVLHYMHKHTHRTPKLVSAGSRMAFLSTPTGPVCFVKHGGAWLKKRLAIPTQDCEDVCISENTQIANVSFGYGHNAIATSQGAAVCFELSDNKADATKMQVTKSLPLNVHICQVSCGAYHVLLLSVCGMAYSFGCGADGQLGHGSKTDVLMPQKIHIYTHTHTHTGIHTDIHTDIHTSIHTGIHTGIHTDALTGIHTDAHPHTHTHTHTHTHAADLRVTCVAAGRRHSLFVLLNGDVYACGRGDRGQLGNAHYRDCVRPTAVCVPQNTHTHTQTQTRIVTAAAGALHSALISASGCVYTFGCNKYGQTGLGYRTELADCRHPQPQKVYTHDNTIMDICCGAYHTIALAAEGHVYVFGSGGGSDPDMQCEQQLTPVSVHSECGRKPIQVAAGDFHSIVVYSNGEIELWDERKKTRFQQRLAIGPQHETKTWKQKKQKNQTPLYKHINSYVFSNPMTSVSWILNNSWQFISFVITEVKKASKE